MKKTQKKFLGLLGLLLVAAVTMFAVFLPGPEATATSSVTDTVVVRVIGGSPNVEIIGDLKDKGNTVYPKQDIAVNYENVEHLTITIKYTDRDGVVHTATLFDQDMTEAPGSVPISLDLSADDFGYGDYVITAKGKGFDGVVDESSISFSYIPITAELVENKDTGDPTIVLEYDPDNGTPEDDGKVSKIEINIYDENGNLVKPSPIIVYAPTKEVILPFSEYGIPSGKYRIELKAFDRHDNELYKAHWLYYDYSTIPVPDTSGDDAKTPDTGEILHGMNISRSDYLLTGLMIFLIVGVGGAVFIVRRDRKSKK